MTCRLFAMADDSESGSASTAALRLQRVEQLKTMIAEGRYFVSSDDLAERIMAAMLRDGARLQ